MATLGGNLLQRPRCWYYRAGNGLLAMKDGKSLVRNGDNRYHAIFMTDGDALFVNPSSLAVPLIALEARATIAGPGGQRTIPVEELYQVPKSEQDREHALAPGEILTKVTIPPAKGRNASYEVRQKQAHDWPLVLASVNLKLDGSQQDASSLTVLDSRVVIYGVAPIPWRSAGAEAVIKGKRISLQTATAAGDAAIEGAKPLSMNAYKVGLTRTSVKRALLAAVGNRYWEF
jgi:xanthine dehydrogenase YagS FAD-binding subunit